MVQYKQSIQCKECKVYRNWGSRFNDCKEWYAYLLIMSIPTEIDPETMPDHNSDRFTQFYDEIVDFKPAFRLADGSVFVLDPDGGYFNWITIRWVDENDCYYDS